MSCEVSIAAFLPVAGSLHRVLGLVLLLALAGCRSAGNSVAHDSFRLTERLLRHPHAGQLADGTILVAWGAVAASGKADIVVSSIPHGERVDVLTRVNRLPGTAVAGRQVGPRMAISPSGRVFVSWVDRSRDSNGDIAVAYSDDGCVTFSEAWWMNDDTGLAGQEYHDVALLSDGRLVVVWLDERDAPEKAPNQKQLYLAVWDADGSLSSNRCLTSSPSGVCPCCRPSVAVSPEGRVHVVYRNRIGDSLMVEVLSSRPVQPFADLEFGAAVAVADVAWEFAGCPVDSPAVTAGPRGEVLVAWKDGALGEERLWLSRSADGGRSFRKPARLDGLASFFNRVDGGRGSFGAVASPCPTLRIVRSEGAKSCQSTGSRASASGWSSVPARPVLAFHPKLGALGGWEDSDGRIWVRSLGGHPSSSSMPRLLADGGEVGGASSLSLLVTQQGIHAFWTEDRYDSLWGDRPAAENDACGEAEPQARSLLRHAFIDANESLVRS